MIQKLAKEYDLKQSKTLLFYKILNQQYISIFGPHQCSQSKGLLKWKPFRYSRNINDLSYAWVSELEQKSVSFTESYAIKWHDFEINEIKQYALVVLIEIPICALKEFERNDHCFTTYYTDKRLLLMTDSQLCKIYNNLYL